MSSFYKCTRRLLHVSGFVGRCRSHPHRRSLTRAWALTLLSAAMSPAYPAQAQDLRIGYPQQFTMSPKGVNLQTGRLVYQQTDINVGSLKLTRMYGTGGGSFASGFGVGAGPSGWQFNGWTHNYSSSMWIDNSTNLPFYRVTVEGTQYTFKMTSSGAIKPGDGGTQGMTLSSSGNSWTMVDHSGNQYTFTGSGVTFLLQNVVYANGSKVTITYNGSTQQPKLIKSNLGYAIVLDYSGNGTISAACGFNSAETYVDASTTCSGSPLVKVTYGYNSAPRLSSVVDARGNTTSINYANTGNNTNISCITLVNSSTCAIQYLYGQTVMSAPDQVTTQTTAANNVWHYDYTPPENPVDVPQQPCWPYWADASMTDASGRMTTALYDRGFLVRLGAPEGTTQYLYPNGCATYGGSGTAPVSVETRLPRPAYIRKPGGIREYYEYDTRGNVTKRAVLPIGTPDPYGLVPTNQDLARCCVNLVTPSMPSGSLVTQATYLVNCEWDPPNAKLCDKPMSVTDPNGNTTTLTYEPAHGGVKATTLPAVNGVTPQTRYTYVQRQAWVKNAGSGYSQTGENIYLLDTKSICKAGNPNSTNTGCALVGDEVATKYEYGPNDGSVGNNLLLRSVIEDYGGLNLRTCYKYDSQGNKISETKPRGATSGCPA